MENNFSSEEAPLLNQSDSDTSSFVTVPNLFPNSDPDSNPNSVPDSNPNSDPNSNPDSVPNSVLKTKTQNPCELCGFQYSPIASKSSMQRQKYYHLASPTHFKERLEGNYGALAEKSLPEGKCPFEHCQLSSNFSKKYDLLTHIGKKHALKNMTSSL